jgi:hypothetical protein
METPKPVRIGYRYGLTQFLIGVILLAINGLILWCTGKYFPMLLVAGITLSLMAPVFIVFPGAAVHVMPPVRERGKILFREASLVHKIIWICWGITSLTCGILALTLSGFFRK